MIELYPYQIEGAEFLAMNNYAILGDEMGIGKSAQSITAADKVLAERVLVLCKAVGRKNWVDEFEKFSVHPRPFFIVKNRKDKPPNDRTSIICNYENVEFLNSIELGVFDVLILDEFHMLKSTEAQRTKEVLGRKGLIRRGLRCWALSGTPAPNHAGELWPILYTFGATVLTFEEWIKKYCTYYIHNNIKRITGTKIEMIPELKNILSKIMLRRTADEVGLQLPGITYSDLTVEAGEVDLQVEASFFQYSIDDDKKKELEYKLRTEKELVDNVVSKVVRRENYDGVKTLEAISRSISTLRRYTGIQKVEAVAKLVAEELEAKAYDKIVLFAVHRDVIEGLRSRLTKFKPVTLYGGTDPDSKDRNVKKFQTQKSCRIFIGNIQAAGTTITLTAANQVMFVEQDWTPGHNAQAVMRVRRIGQTKPVFARYVGLENSFDEHVAKVLRRKTKQLVALFDEPYLTKVSDENICTENAIKSDDKTTTVVSSDDIFS